jgi:outer membrane protein assembly factor BamB/TolA-binding protein
MSPSELLEKLDALGTIDAKILRKIHRQVESPGKVVKVSAVLKFLVKNDQLTEAQARELFKESKSAAAPAATVTPDPPAPKTADHFEVTEEPADNEHDTGDLIGGVNEEVVPAKPAPDPEPEPEAIAEVEPEIVAEVEPEIVAEVEPEPAKKSKRKKKKAVEPEPEVISEPTFDNAGFDDETTLDMDAGFDDSEKPDSSGKARGFQGKIDKSNQWKTKWLYIGFGVLATLLIGVGVLWLAVSGVSAEDLYKAAQDNFKKQSYPAAVKQFDEYIKKYPTHKNVHDARATRAQAVLRTAYDASRWDEVLKRAEIELPPLADGDYEKSELPSIRNDLSVMLPSSLRHITHAATDLREVSEMKEAKTKIENFRKTIENPVYIPPSFRKRPGTAKVLDQIENNVKVLDGHIQKEQDYASTLGEIKKLADEGKTDTAFQRYRKLTRNYGDLSSREALQNLMLEVSKRESDLVQPVTIDAATSQSPAPSAISRTLALGSKSGTPIPGLKGEVLTFLAEGSIYGVDASDGSIVWRRFVGYQTTIGPQSLDDGSLIVVDGQRNDLLRLDQRTGGVVWRTEIGNSMFSPTIAGQRITVTTSDGHVINVNAQTGQITASVKLPQTCNTSAAASERDPFIYQIGNYSNLYILSGDDLSAREVYYVGHDKNAVAIPPYLWSGYILVAVNSGEGCDLLVLKPTADGLGLNLVQLISRITNGPITSPFQRYGRWLFNIADNGEMRLLELDASNETNPVRTLASDLLDNRDGHKLFALTEGNNLWLASKGILRYRIKRALGKFERGTSDEPTDLFIAPMQTIDDNLLHVRRRLDSGMLSVSLVDKESLKPLWRTDFGGSLAGSPVETENGLLAFNNQGDAFMIGDSDLASGTTGDSIRSSDIVENLRFRHLTELENGGLALTGPTGRGSAVYFDVSKQKTRLMELESPANTPDAKPLAMDGYLIVPSVQGQVTRIDPKNGRMVGTPFQPPLKPGTKTHWFDPIAIDTDLVALTSTGADGSGGGTLHLVNTSSSARLVEVASFPASGQFVSGPVLFNDSIYAVTRDGGQDSVIALSIGNNIAVQDTANLDAKCVGGPWLVADRLLMVLDNDQLVSLAAPMSPEWSIGIPNQSFAFPPTVTGSQIMLGFQNGLLVWLDPATGNVVNQRDLGQPISGIPLLWQNKLYFGGLDGTVHEVDPATW